MTNQASITDEQIETLETEAACALDHVQVGLCQIALTGAIGNLNLTDSERTRLMATSRVAARAACARAIASANAQVEA